MPVQQVFKKFEVVTAWNPEDLGAKVTELLGLGKGWQVSSPMMCVSTIDGGLYHYVTMMLFEFVVTPDAPPEQQSVEANVVDKLDSEGTPVE